MTLADYRCRKFSGSSAAPRAAELPKLARERFPEPSQRSPVVPHKNQTCPEVQSMRNGNCSIPPVQYGLLAFLWGNSTFGSRVCPDCPTRRGEVAVRLWLICTSRQVHRHVSSKS